MAELSIRVIDQSAVLENLLLNELAPLIEGLDKNASVTIAVKEGKVDLKFVGVDEESKQSILLKAEEVMNTFAANQ